MILYETCDVITYAKIPSGAAVKDEGGVAGEGKLVGAPKFHFWACHNEYQLILDVQHFLWPVYYIIYIKGSFNSHLGM